MEEVIKQKGNIEWFPVSQFPKINDHGFSSEILLLNLKRTLLSKGRYYQADHRLFVPDTGAWMATHWAYLNFPEPAQD